MKKPQQCRKLGKVHCHAEFGFITPVSAQAGAQSTGAVSASQGGGNGVFTSRSNTIHRKHQNKYIQDMDKGSLNWLQIGGKSPQNCVSTRKEKGRITTNRPIVLILLKWYLHYLQMLGSLEAFCQTIPSSRNCN